MVREHFNSVQRKQIENLSEKDKAKVWFNRLLAKEINLKTYKTGIDFILPKIPKSRGEIG